MIRLGVIGYGGRIRGVLRVMEQMSAGTEVVAITDVRNDEIKQQMEASGKDVALYDDADEMLDKEELDGVMIGTRCSLHAQMAVKVLARNLPLYLEKPVATTMDDLLALREAAEKSSSEVVVSFPLRVSPLAQVVKEIVDSGKLGTV